MNPSLKRVVCKLQRFLCKKLLLKTQKIERPGKACAITPCDEAEGPWVILDDGHFIRIDDPASYSKLKSRVKQVWDNGELVIGYGEFMENNKRLVPAGYSVDAAPATRRPELVSR